MWSRRPLQVLRFGAASNASISTVVRKDRGRRSVFFCGIASTCWIVAACSGWR